MGLKIWFWPKVDGRKNALLAIDEAFWVTVVVACFFAVWNLLEITRPGNETMDYRGFVVAAILGLAALGIWFKSRIAAVAAFVVYVYIRLFVLWHYGVGGLILVIAVSLALLQGIRGTFLYHKLPRIPAGTPSVADSFAAMKKTEAEPTNTPKK